MAHALPLASAPGVPSCLRVFVVNHAAQRPNNKHDQALSDVSNKTATKGHCAQHAQEGGVKN